MTKWFNFIKNKNKKQNETSSENVTCKNCETVFNGKYCPECGQSITDYDKPFTFIFYNFAGDFFSFDARFFRTFGALLVKPGSLTAEYFKGRRVKYAPPFRIFIFMSFILFLLLQIYTNRGLTSVLDSELKDGKVAVDSSAFAVADSILNDIKLGYDSTYSSAIDSVLKSIGVQVDSVSENNLNFKINMETFRDTRNLRQALNKLANGIEKDMDAVTDPKEKAKKLEYIRLCRSPEQAMVKILEYMSWAFFLLLPIFALILKLVYIRRNQNYMRHLIFSIHVHSFIFFVITIIVGLYLLFNTNLQFISTLLILSVPVYLVLAMKKFYGQSFGKVILKFIGVSFLYNIIFFVTVGIVFLNALSII